MWSTTSDVDEFHAVAGAALRARPVENTLLLTIAAKVADTGGGVPGGSPPAFGWHTDGSAFVWTPPRALLIGGSATVAASTELAELLDDVPGVNSTDEAARAFADAWCRRTGVTARPGLRSRLYRLGELVPPVVAGRARVAGAGDRDLLVAWLTTCAEELHEPLASPGRAADLGVRDGAYGLWEVDGTPVALAGRRRPAGGVVRIGPVYTPRQHRGRGYGSAVTAAVSAWSLPHEVVLFTDLSNPTSNSIYTKIGYRPVEDRQLFEF
ncbi:Predicted acetyltransferase, GNAT family [Asanoa hainanensis]|uniref:Predicted acetyltransferase, GNAT family n=1 Tax=Asanoa hainanensis TaxID=560556 RepID=A0A239NSJ6_9ACTN|nr:GNAT family N-acetyltransferase [Asanoa hainanensis]SNT57413.1 Predicted acetyltransferase, GNAT family [Asanoa hainanensis]